MSRFRAPKDSRDDDVRVNVWERLGTFGNFWELLGTFGNVWERLSEFFWELLGMIGNF